MGRKGHIIIIEIKKKMLSKIDHRTDLLFLFIIYKIGRSPHRYWVHIFISIFLFI